jgi:hypothetical protein
MNEHSFQIGDTVIPKSYLASGYLLYMSIHSFTDHTGKTYSPTASPYVLCKYYHQPDGSFRKELFHINEIQEP